MTSSLADAPPDPGGADESDEPLEALPVDGGAPPLTSRAYLAGLSAVVVLQVLMQEWGKVTHDTRLDQLLAPGQFLAKIWTFWDPITDMGHIRNQTIGYAFPMGPTMFAGRVLGLPPWIVGRLWIAGLLVAALWGAVRLLDELEIGPTGVRLVAGASYALGPFLVARVGNTSSFVLGAAFLPWVVLMLVRGSRRGSVRRYAALAGVGVLFMGGINAAVTLSVLAMPVLWLLTRGRGPRRRRLVLWSFLALVLACFWWAAPLVLQGKYGVDFLHFTETARVTTFFNPPFEAIRGVADWLSYFRVDEIMTAAGDTEVTNPMVILATGLVAAIGVFGLARRDMVERAFLWLTFLAGVAVVSAGYGGVLGNPLSSVVRQALDGPFGAFRTVYKFAPIVALVLAIGFAHGVTVIGRAVQQRRPRGMVVVTVLAGLLVVAGAWPLVRGDLLNPRGFDAVPDWWKQAATYVQDTPGRALLMPGLAHGDFYWGYTAEEPLDWNASGEWAARNLTFQASEGAVTFMDSVAAAVARGGDPNLPSVLSNAGFTQVVVRNDGRWSGDDAPPAQSLNAALLASGMEPVKGFGPVVNFSTDPGVQSIPLQAVEIYQVPGAASVQAADAISASDVVAVSGDAGARLQMAAGDLTDRPTILVQDLSSDVPVPSNWIVTDGNQRRFTYYGRLVDSKTFVLRADEKGPSGQSAEAGLPLGSAAEDQTVAVLDGVSSVTASSYGAFFKPVPEVAPAKALDGDPETAWASAGYADVTGQWLQVDLASPLDPGTIGVQLLDDGPWRPTVTAIDVSTEQGTVRTETQPGEQLQQLEVPPGETSWIRLTIVSVDTSSEAVTGVGIREVQIPDVSVDQRLLVPSQLGDRFSDPSTDLPAYVFQRTAANPRFFLRKDEEPTMRRRFALPRDGALAPSAALRAAPSPALLDVVDDTPTFSIDASSTLGDLPGYAPRHLVDGEDQTIWIAEGSPLAQATRDAVGGGAQRVDGGSAAGAAPATPEDGRPYITMDWRQPRVVTGLTMTRVDGYSSPASVRVETPDGQVREADVADDGTVRFDPLVASKVTLTFPRVARYAISNGFGEPTDRPLGLASLVMTGTEDLLPGDIDRSQPVSFSCAQGPTVAVDGQRTAFSVSATVGELLDFRALAGQACRGPFDLQGGLHDLDTANGSAPLSILTTSLADARTAAALSAPAEPRATTITSWDDTTRKVDIAPGAEAYLIVHESANIGWGATLDGKKLTPVTIDGWQQGYLVPEGDGGTVTLHYAPTTTYRASILLGGLLVVLLVGLAVVPDRRPSLPPLRARNLHPLLLWAVAGVAMFVSGGVAGLVLLGAMFALVRRRDRWPARLAGGSFAVAAVVVAVTQTSFPEEIWGAFGNVASVLSLLALAAVAAAVLPPSLRPAADTGDGPDDEPEPESRAPVAVGPVDDGADDDRPTDPDGDAGEGG